MLNPFSEDTLFEQPAIRLFKDEPGWQAVFVEAGWRREGMFLLAKRDAEAGLSVNEKARA